MTQHVTGKKVQSSASLEWTYDIPKIATFGLVKFFSSTQDILYRVLRGKTSNFDFFFLSKKAFMMGTVRIKLVF